MYETLSAVYEWLVPDELLEPEGAVAAFAALIGDLPPGARVLDCAAGTGQLAVGLALRGYDMTASDASAAMVARTEALATARGVALRTAVRRWEELAVSEGPFAAVFCVGNSLTHAGPRRDRRASLAAIAGVLAPGGLLVLTSRNWESVRAAGSRLEAADRLVERGGRRGLVVRRWTIADGWDERHELDVAVALIGADGGVELHAERLEFWPFRVRELDEDLRAAGLEPADSTYEPEVDRYAVTARRPGAGAGAGSPRPAA